MKMVVALALGVLAGAASATDLSVFGINLGQAPTLPECPFRLSGGRLKLYDTLPAATCIQDARPLTGYGQPAREVTFGRGEAPTIAKWGRAFLLQDSSGQVIGIHFLTLGLQTQDVVLAQLKAKYGPPTTITPRTIRTAVGGPFETFDAKWVFEDLIVNFRAADGAIDRGDVTVDLPAGATLRQQWLLNPTERKL